MANGEEGERGSGVPLALDTLLLGLFPASAAELLLLLLDFLLFLLLPLLFGLSVEAAAEGEGAGTACEGNHSTRDPSRVRSVAN